MEAADLTATVVAKSSETLPILMATSNDSNNRGGTDPLFVLVSNNSTCGDNGYSNDDFFDSQTISDREMATTLPLVGFPVTHVIQRRSDGGVSMEGSAGDTLATQRRYRWRSMLKKQQGIEKEKKVNFMWSLEGTVDQNKVEFG
ncbi:unnamed protein product [Lactuca saligna]|uniref:Uncharacterized protein n=1 Tax=Lactuca saligna TaxID=75948 RepID=A0AA35V8T5_LACSI|nr:unnamed protein product [Lactuca saligna]